MGWYLSFDCATKNMGVSFYKYDINYINKINNLLNSKYENINDIKGDIHNIFEKYNINIIKNIILIIDNIIDIKFFKLINIIDNDKLKDTNIITRTIKLKEELNNLENIIKKEQINDIINLHIEYQMNINNCSLAVMNQLIYHYTTINDNTTINDYTNKYKIQIIYPALKNKLYFHNNLKHRIFIQKYNSNYKSNKEHSKYNLLYYLYIFKKHNLIKDFSLKKIDDIADSFMQSIVNINIKN